MKIIQETPKITNDTAHHGAKTNSASRAVMTNLNITASKTVSGLECRQRRETSARYPGGEEVQTAMTGGFSQRSV